MKGSVDQGILMTSPRTIPIEKTRQLLYTIDRLYDAVCDLEKWPAFLAEAAKLLDSRGTQIGHHDLNLQQLSFSRLHGYDWDADHYQRYAALIPKDPRLPYFVSNPFKAVHCRMGVDEDRFHQSRVYREVLAPGGVEYSLGVSLQEESSSLSYFIALRAPDQPPFNSDDCALLEELIPHLRRAMQLQSEFAILEVEKQMSFRALDAMAMGIVILGADMEIRFQNRTSLAILGCKDGIEENEGFLTVERGQDKHFRRLVKRIITESSIGNPPPGESMDLSRPSGKRAYRLFVSPFWGQRLRTGWSQVREPLAFVVLQDPASPNESRQELLTRQYGLTPSQAGLANLLCEGMSIRDAARSAGLTEASARQYLKLIFQKLSVSRQAELVSKILSLPHVLPKS